MGVGMGPRPDTHNVYGIPTTSPIEGAHEIKVSFTIHAILPWGFLFSEMGALAVPQLTITIAFYDLHRRNGSILSSPIPQDNIITLVIATFCTLIICLVVLLLSLSSSSSS